jgi:hypothetical protein
VPFLESRYPVRKQVSSPSPWRHGTTSLQCDCVTALCTAFPVQVMERVLLSYIAYPKLREWQSPGTEGLTSLNHLLESCLPNNLTRWSHEGEVNVYYFTPWKCVPSFFTELHDSKCRTWTQNSQTRMDQYSVNIWVEV